LGAAPIEKLSQNTKRDPEKGDKSPSVLGSVAFSAGGSSVWPAGCFRPPNAAPTGSRPHWGPLKPRTSGSCVWHLPFHYCRDWITP